MYRLPSNSDSSAEQRPSQTQAGQQDEESRCQYRTYLHVLPTTVVVLFHGNYGRLLQIHWICLPLFVSFFFFSFSFSFSFFFKCWWAPWQEWNVSSSHQVRQGGRPFFFPSPVFLHGSFKEFRSSLIYKYTPSRLYIYVVPVRLFSNGEMWIAKSGKPIQEIHVFPTDLVFH